MAIVQNRSDHAVGVSLGTPTEDRMADTHRNTGLHAVTLESGQPVGVGETCTPGDNDHDQGLIADGHLSAVETATDYDAMHVDQLQALAAGAGLEIDGTGKDGAVLKADLTKALKSNEKKGA